MKTLAVIVCIFITLLPLPEAQSVPYESLPDLGSFADAILSQSEEKRIGRMIVRGLRDAGQILEDPEVTEYVQSVAHRLAIHAHDGDHEFEFFVVNNPNINAFALPGGFIGINYGLILAADSESEMAGVLAHEIAHVTQRHIARQLDANKKTSWTSAAAMVALILIGATADVDGDLMNAGIVGVQGLAVQSRINFTRSNETEADRVGLAILAESGFDPEGMPRFFEKLGRSRSGADEYFVVPEYLRTHPLETSRISETRMRALDYPQRHVPSSKEFLLNKERLRVFNSETSGSAIEYYVDRGNQEAAPQSEAERYGLGLALIDDGDADEAIDIFSNLLANDSTVIAYHSGLGQAQMDAGHPVEALATFEKAVALFPRNIPLTIRYTEALLREGHGVEAHLVLLDLLNNVRPTPDQVRLLALAASAAGETAEAHYYMCEYHVMSGELNEAINQLELALSVPELLAIQHARFAARLVQLQQYLPKRKRPRLDEQG